MTRKSRHFVYRHLMSAGLGAMLVLPGCGGADVGGSASSRPVQRDVPEEPYVIALGGGTMGTSTIRGATQRPPLAVPAGAYARPSHAAASPAESSCPNAATGKGEVRLVIEFVTGTSELDAASRAELNKVAGAMNHTSLSDCQFRIEGRTDNVGRAASNLWLSEKRARAVADHLSSPPNNVSRARLAPIGLGQTFPIVETPPQTPEARNRIVRIVKLDE